jgi:hypothetical protein
MAKKVRRTCKKRKGSPRFAAPCKAKFRTCQRDTLKSTGSMRAAGKKCMPLLNSCNKKAGPALRKYKRAKAK